MLDMEKIRAVGLQKEAHSQALEGFPLVNEGKVYLPLTIPGRGHFQGGDDVHT